VKNLGLTAYAYCDMADIGYVDFLLTLSFHNHNK